MTDKKYQVIYADPPWNYGNKYTGGGYKRKDGTVQTGRAADNYDTMNVSDIMEMNIPAAKNSVLFMWATVPLMPDAFKVMDAWGFQYKTMITWRKIMSRGMGYWYRGQCEHLLLGVRGKIKAFRMQEANIIQCKVGAHSSKPHEFRQLIERSTPTMPDKLEMFARFQWPGWDVFGNQVNNSIEL